MDVHTHCDLSTRNGRVTVCITECDGALLTIRLDPKAQIIGRKWFTRYRVVILQNGTPDLLRSNRSGVRIRPGVPFVQPAECSPFESDFSLYALCEIALKRLAIQVVRVARGPTGKITGNSGALPLQ